MVRRKPSSVPMGTVAELAAGGRFPIVAGSVVSIGHRKSGSLGIVLRVIAGHFVDHHIERRNHDDSKPSRLLI